MIVNHDFSPEAADPEVSARPTPEPRVVIEYRNRGLPAALLAPLLILLATVAIVSYQRETPIRRFRPTQIVIAEPPAPSPESPAGSKGSGPIVETPARPPAPPAPPGEGTAVVAPAEGPKVAGAESQAEPPRAAGEVASSVPRSPLAEIQAPVAGTAEPVAPPARKAPAPPALAANLTPDPVPSPVPPKVDREQVIRDIQREAELKEAEIQRLERLKPQARYFAITEMFRKAQANRLPFHAALRAALRSGKPNLGETIESLCNEFGRTANPDIQKHFRRLLRTSYARLSRRSKVELMREWGFPEPMILDFLSHELDPLVGSRGGPRSGDEVRVWAARVLLTMPPMSPPSTRPSPGVDPNREPAAVRRSR